MDSKRPMRLDVHTRKKIGDRGNMAECKTEAKTSAAECEQTNAGVRLTRRICKDGRPDLPASSAWIEDALDLAWRYAMYKGALDVAHVLGDARLFAKEQPQEQMAWDALENHIRNRPNAA
jgi:hypothetical protein